MRKSTPRKRWVLVASLLATALVAAAVVTSRLSQSQPPSILLITLDTTRADRIGCYGYESAETPHLDALARQGVLFERAYAPAPMTAPSHASLLTGLWPPEHAVITNGKMALAPGIPTMAELLKDRSYDTAAFLSAVPLKAKFGLHRGFRIYEDDLSTAAHNADPLHQARDGRYTVDSAITWLAERHRKADDSPFFCWVHLYDPHDPYELHPEELGERFDDRPYDGEIAYTDLLVGRLLGALEQFGVHDKTIVIAVGDHGESLGEHGEKTHGYMLHESTLRVPLIIADPSRKTAGVRMATPVSLVDLFPTLLELAGVDPPEELRSRSLHPALEGNALQPRMCFSQTEEPYIHAFWSPLQGLTTERWRYVRTTKPELYDLAADPRELVNLADRQPDTVQELEAELVAFEATLERRTSGHVALSPQEQRALESLGYTGGESAGTGPKPGDQPLPDIKDMIDTLNLVNQAAELMVEEKYDDAVAILEPLARDTPNFLRAWLELGACRLLQNDYEEAARCFETAVAIDPNSDSAQKMLGTAYLRLNKLDLAEKHLSKHLELAPNSEFGHLYLGQVQQLQGQFQLAMRSYGMVLQINPQNAAARRSLDALMRRGGHP